MPNESVEMNQLDMEFETNSNGPPEGQHGENAHILEAYREEHTHTDPVANDDARIDDDGGRFRLREHVRALREQLRALKEVVLESGGTFINPMDEPSQVSPCTLQHQPFDPQVLSEVTSERNLYFIRVQNLELRVGRLLSSGLIGGNGDFQDTFDQRNGAAVDRNGLFYEIHRDGGFLSQIESESLRMRDELESTESEILAKLDAAKAETRTVEADRDTLIDENDDLRERLKTMLIGYEGLVQHRNSLQTQRNRLQSQLDASEDPGIDSGDPESEDEAVRRKERRELRPGQPLDTTRSTPTTSANKNCEEQLTLVQAERDSAIKQNEEARRTLATRTAERNGAHQRIRILEASLKEIQEREAQLQAEIRSNESQERTQTNLLNTETNTCEAERKEIEFLQEELEHAVAAASKAQHERDAARVEIKALEEENAIANSAAETANDVVIELQESLEAANNAALAEREKSEESRRTQNRLRIERETVRIEVAKLERELSAAHQVSMGLVRHGNITVGDLVHIREEKDAALTRLGILQAELDTANDRASELQRALDDCLARHANGPTDDLALEELSRVILQRDEALAHVRELERFLEELEDDYRKNLDQWELQTQRDEKEINDSKSRLEEEEKRSKDLSDQLKAAKTGLKAAETRARAAEERAEIAEGSLATSQIQNQQIEQDLDHSNEDREELEAACDRLRTECLRLGGMVIAVRNEVIRLGGTTVAPDGTVQGEDGWPNGPPYLGPDPSDIPRPPTAKPQPLPEGPDEDGDNPFSYPIAKATKIRRHSSKSTGANESFSSDSSSSESCASIPEASPFQLHPRQRPARRSHSTPPLQTSPTMSTQTDPRSTRNPEPEYGAPSRSRSRKRKADSHEKPGSPKKRRSNS